MILFQILTVGTRTHIESVYPCSRHELYQILVSVIVLCQHDEVIAALVLLRVGAVALMSSCHIHLTSEYRLELGLTIIAQLAIYLVAIVEQLFHTEHVSMVGDCHSLHAVGNRFVNEFLDARLSVKYTIIRMNVKMYEILHLS